MQIEMAPCNDIECQTDEVVVKEVPKESDIKEFKSLAIQTLTFKKQTRTLGFQAGLTEEQAALAKLKNQKAMGVQVGYEKTDSSVQAVEEKRMEDQAVQIEAIAVQDASTQNIVTMVDGETQNHVEMCF